MVIDHLHAASVNKRSRYSLPPVRTGVGAREVTLSPILSPDEAGSTVLADQHAVNAHEEFLAFGMRVVSASDAIL